MFEYGHWKSRFKKPDNAIAFTYFMIFSDRTGNIKYYIGYKNIKTVRRPWLRYNSSSKYVKKNFINTCIHREITAWFDDSKIARLFETEQLKLFNAKESNIFVNKSNGDALPEVSTPEYTKNLWQDPEYVAKQSAAHLASMKDPTQIANRQAEAERRAQDPKFREHLLNNLAKMKADPTVKQKQADAFKKELSHNGIIYKNPQEASAALGLSVDVIRKRCRELKDGFKYTSDRVDTKKVKKVSYNGKEYNSVTDAAKDLSISRKKITRLCESEQDGFKYIE